MPPVTIKPPTPGRPQRKRNAPPVPLPLRLALVFLSLVALVISVYIGYMSFTGSPLAGCAGPESGCGSVLSSVWSKWFNIPVAIPAASLYATVLVALCFTFGFAPPNIRAGAWKFVAALLLLAALSGIWFIALQALVVKHFCAWCTTVHSCGILLFALAFVLVPLARRGPALLTAVTTAGLALLIGGQILSDAPQTYSSEEIAFDDADIIATTPTTRPVTTPQPTSAENHTVRRPPEIDAVPDEDSQPTAPHTPEQQTTAAEPPATTRQSSDPTPASDPEPTVDPEDFTDPPTPLVDEYAGDSQENEADSPSPTIEIAEQAPPLRQRLIPVGHGQEPINAYDWPVLGSADADCLILEMFDYCCSHCRHTAEYLDNAQLRYGEQVGIVLMPMPMSHRCNRLFPSTSHDFRDSCALAQTALAVWRVAPEEFEDFHHWMMEGEDPPSQQAAFQRAKELVGLDPLLEALQEPEIDQQISRSVDLYEAFNKGVIPKLVIGSRLLAGQVGSAEIIFIELEKQFEIVPQN